MVIDQISHPDQKRFPDFDALYNAIVEHYGSGTIPEVGLNRSFMKNELDCNPVYARRLAEHYAAYQPDGDAAGSRQKLRVAICIMGNYF